MKVLFIHQNMPGQFKHLAPALARAGHKVVFLTQRGVQDPRDLRRDHIADKAAAAVTEQGSLGHLRKAARQTVLDRYDLSRCLPEQIRLVEEVAAMRAGA